MDPVSFILTDIEGTTSSISFVAEELFPYFRQHIRALLTMKDKPEVAGAFAETVRLAESEDGEVLNTDEAIIATLHRWSEEDRKITPLKTLQGVLWEKGYRDGALKGHVYPDVAPKLREWKNKGIGLGVFSSGSVAAQKLLFGYSTAGDLTSCFSAYFDTNTGGKRETGTYRKIAEQLGIPAERILFLSDIREELAAADAAGYQTVQLLRERTTGDWEATAADFHGIAV